MKKLVQFTSIIFLIFMCSIKIHGAERYEDSMTVEFSDPAKPGVVKVVSGNGDVTVTGYDGNEVIIKTKSEVKNLVNTPENEKAKGLKRISGTSFNVVTVEDENAVVITRSLKDEIDLFLQVPFKTSLIIGGGDVVTGVSVHIVEKNKTTGTRNQVPVPIIGGKTRRIIEGDVVVENVSGEMEINTIDGDITLQEISGNVVAHSVDGDLLIILNSVDKEKPMSLSTVEGDIDVTLPADLKADLTLKTVDGEIYSGFDMDIVRNPEVVKEVKEKRHTGYPDILRFYGTGNIISAKINGGGTEIQMTTIDGDIFIRKGK